MRATELCIKCVHKDCAVFNEPCEKCLGLRIPSNWESKDVYDYKSTLVDKLESKKRKGRDLESHFTNETLDMIIKMIKEEK